MVKSTTCEVQRHLSETSKQQDERTATSQDVTVIVPEVGIRLSWLILIYWNDKFLIPTVMLCCLPSFQFVIVIVGLLKGNNRPSFVYSAVYSAEENEEQIWFNGGYYHRCLFRGI